MATYKPLRNHDPNPAPETCIKTIAISLKMPINYAWKQPLDDTKGLSRNSGAVHMIPMWVAGTHHRVRTMGLQRVSILPAVLYR